MFTSLWKTTDVVVVHVSHDVPSVFLNYTDVMLDVPAYAHIGIPAFEFQQCKAIA